MALKRRRNGKTLTKIVKFSFFIITSGILGLTQYTEGEPYCYMLESLDESNGHFKTRSAYFKRVECDGSSKICKQFASREAVSWVELLNSHCLSKQNYSSPLEDSYEEQPKCQSPMEYHTNTMYYYRYLKISTGTKRMVFEVKSNSDAYIALSPSKNSSVFYKIVIGGWDNTRSVIRRCSQCEDKTSKATYHYLSGNEFRKFWITFGNDGTIAVGREDESTPFMKWTDPDPLDIQYLGYSTGWGSSGVFRFCNVG